MKKIILILGLLCPGILFAQGSTPSIVPVAVAPSGACIGALPLQLQTPNGVLYTCQSGVWAALAGTGSGTVSPGGSFKLPSYPSASTAAVSPSNLTTDATGNNLNLPGILSQNSVTPVNTTQLRYRIQSNASATTYGGGYWAVADAPTTFNAVTDNTLDMGYNNAGGCAPIDATKWTFCDQTELDFFDGAHHWLERWLGAQNNTGGATRPFNWGMELDSPNVSSWNFTIGTGLGSQFSVNVQDFNTGTRYDNVFLVTGGPNEDAQWILKDYRNSTSSGFSCRIAATVLAQCGDPSTGASALSDIMIGLDIMGAAAKPYVDIQAAKIEVKNGPLQVDAATFASLPACSGNEGMQRPVTDSTTATWGATITGSGTNHVLAYCDGTNWTVAAK